MESFVRIQYDPDLIIIVHEKHENSTVDYQCCTGIVIATGDCHIILERKIIMVASYTYYGITMDSAHGSYILW